MTRTAVMAMSEQVTAAAELVSGEAAALLASVEAAKKRREEAGR